MSLNFQIFWPVASPHKTSPATFSPKNTAYERLGVQVFRCSSVQVFRAYGLGVQGVQSVQGVQGVWVFKCLGV